MILVLSWSLLDLGPLGLYKDIDDARAPCTWLVHVLRLWEYRLSDNRHAPHVHNYVPPAHAPWILLEPPSKPLFQYHASLVITTSAQLHYIITTSRSRGGAFGWFIVLILYIILKFYIKSIKRPSKQASRTISVKQAKLASSRCLKLQASKLKALSLACLLVTNSSY
jgi:hypothetical protein